MNPERPGPPARDRTPRPDPVPRAPVNLAPPLSRDPWAWASALAVLPLVLHSLGAHLGEPVAEDFDFLHRALLSGNHSLLDGGGSTAFWRPMAHQFYYLALGPLMLAHPGAVVALHAVLLAVTSLLLYRTFRLAWRGPVAAAAATFPLLAESTRTLIAWSSYFVDLGLLLFSALALHEASRRRMTTALAALLAALLCKELAVVTALLMPWVPRAAAPGPPSPPPGPRDRVRWAAATGALVAVWATAYVVIRHRAHLALPHELETYMRIVPTPWIARIGWAFKGSLKAVMSLPIVRSPADPVALVAVIGIAAAAGLMLARSAEARARLARAWAWPAWGITWFAAATSTLPLVFPFWAPNRSAFGSLGLGAAITVALDAIHPALLAVLVGARLVTFAMSPGPPPEITKEQPATGAFMDFEHLARLQRLMAETRARLRAEYPALPHGARICQLGLPLMSEYAFGGDQAVQVWYRDTTLRWVTLDRFRSDPNLEVTTIVEFQAHHSPEIALVEPQAMRALDRATEQVAHGAWQLGLLDLARSDSLQRDPEAGVFRAMVASRRTLCLRGLGRTREAEAEARRALALWPEDPNAHYLLAVLMSADGRLAEAEAQLDSHVVRFAEDSDAVALRERVRAARAEFPRFGGR